MSKIDSHSEKISNPDYIGPGLWYIIHTLASKSNDDESKHNFVNFMKLIRDSFRCTKCKFHLTQFMELNKFEPYWHIVENGQQVGMFKWSWKAHNAVNIRNGKNFMEWDIAYNLYYVNQGVCSTKCLEGVPNNETKNEQSPFSITQAINGSQLYLKSGTSETKENKKLTLRPSSVKKN